MESLGTLLSDFHSLDCEKHISAGYGPLRSWYFVMAVQTAQDLWIQEAFPLFASFQMKELI
jgi:hypothetical protein